MEKYIETLAQKNKNKSNTPRDGIHNKGKKTHN